MAARWKVDGARGVWLVRGDARAAGVHGEAFGREVAAARVDGWFPEGWGHEGAGTLAAVCQALEGSFAEGESPEVGWLKRTLRKALRDGRMTAVRVGLGAPLWGADEVEEEPVTAWRPVPETTWVGIKVIDDRTNRPIPGVKLTITLPDGSKGDHTTNREGLVMLDPVRAGICALRTEIDDLRMKTTLEVVGTGDGPIDDASPERKNGPRRLAMVEHHKVRTGESLDSLAKANGMTWKELSRFNFGTDDPVKVNEHLRSQVGCTKKTADQRNYVLSSSDEPGIVHIPQRLARTGMRTGQTHVLRARPSDEAYDEAFVLVDHETAEPLPRCRYRIVRESGEVIEGLTDAKGRTALVCSARPERILVEVFPGEKPGGG
jgi:LysM domain